MSEEKKVTAKDIYDECLKDRMLLFNLRETLNTLCDRIKDATNSTVIKDCGDSFYNLASSYGNVQKLEIMIGDILSRDLEKRNEPKTSK